MTREEAIEVYNGLLNQKIKEAFEFFAPELAGSEEERIRKRIRLCLDECVHSDIIRDYERDECLAYLEKQKEQKPIKMEVYEAGKGTTICGQDYKCKKDYKEGNCWYIKDVIYHCGRDGYLTDQNGVSWSCTPEWFKEYIQSNTEWAEEEKNCFVSGQFLQCKLSFDEFKEGEHYWLEYVGDDTYVGRSDNILNLKFHITPRQLYTLFTQHLEEKQKEQKPNPLYGSTEEYYREAYYDQPEKEQKPAEWSEEDEKRIKQLIYDTEHIRAEYEKRKKELGESFNDELIKDCDEQIAWLKSLLMRCPKSSDIWKPSEEQSIKED